MLWDLLQLFIQLFAGVFAAVLRLLMAIGLLLVALRVDRSVFPAWVDGSSCSMRWRSHSAR